jgi:glutamyl-tRNA synthetase
LSGCAERASLQLARGAPPVGRLAPSPTGFLHLGHARSFLLAYWHARSRAGFLKLRLDDLDGERCRPEFADAALFDLEWLGLEWDGPVYRQSQGRNAMIRAAVGLVARSLAYPCVCSRSEIRALQNAPHGDDGEQRYPGTCRGRYRSLAAAEGETSRPAGIRFIVADAPVTIADGFAPATTFDVAAQSGDFLIARRDGRPAYQLAVVLDDAHQGVTEVVRGSDLLASTARQRLLQSALGLTAPRTFHVPLVVDASGRRLAKRADDLSLRDLRASGIDARAIVAWAARSAGIDAPERVGVGEVTSVFDLERVPRDPVVVTERTVQSLGFERR